MNIFVVLFFLSTVLATLILGFRFASQKDHTFKHFGVAFILLGIAFIIWSGAVMQNVVNLDQAITVGSIFLIASIISFFISGIQHLHVKTRQAWTVLGVIAGLIILYVRAFVFPSAPSLSEQGFFFFNAQPFMKMIYILALTLAVIPAIEAVAAKIKIPRYSMLVRYGFIIELAGSLVLLTSSAGSASETVFNVIGWIIAIVYFILWVMLLSTKKIWE